MALTQHSRVTVSSARVTAGVAMTAAEAYGQCGSVRVCQCSFRCSKSAAMFTGPAATGICSKQVTEPLRGLLAV